MNRHFFKKIRWKTQCNSRSPDLYSASPSRRPPEVQVPPGSLAIAALATLLPPIDFISKLALSFTRLSVAGVWAVSSTALLQKPQKFGPAVLIQAGSWNRCCSTPGYRLPWLMLWWRIRSAPSAGGSYHTGASLQRSRLVPRPVVLDVLALSWRSRSSR